MKKIQIKPCPFCGGKITKDRGINHERNCYLNSPEIEDISNDSIEDFKIMWNKRYNENIEKLIIAAKKIDDLSLQKEELSKAWRRLTNDAKQPNADKKEIEDRKKILNSTLIVGFSSAIDDLREALKGV